MIGCSWGIALVAVGVSLGWSYGMSDVSAAPTDVTDPNYDEEAVQAFTLPNILEGPDGVAASTAKAWEQTSRPYQFRQLQTVISKPSNSPFSKAELTLKQPRINLYSGCFGSIPQPKQHPDCLFPMRL